MKTKLNIRHIAASAAAFLTLGIPALAQDNDTGAILDRFAADYLQDFTFNQSVEFGVLVDGDDWWTVSMDHDAGSYTVTQAQPQTPTLYFPATSEVLALVDRGEMTALTAMVKAFSTDVSPMDMDLMEGAAFDPGMLAQTFHFWTRGNPEIINFNDLQTRFVHGGNAAVFYYQPGFRSGFGYVMPGQHVNEDERSRTNEFETLIIFLEGRATARLNGVDQEVHGGQAIFIPAGMTHEFLNPYDEPAQFLLFMFGEGA
tara:strand:- start:4422 stop:5192 length:771 start_codon:yes stop_codon:yes gene_type:complete